MKPVWHTTAAFDTLTGNGDGYEFGDNVKANSLVGGLFWRPSAWYYDKTHTTYIIGISPNTGGTGSLRPLLYQYNHASRSLEYRTDAASISENETDTHQRAAMLVANNGKIVIGREDGHITPIYTSILDVDSSSFRDGPNFGTLDAYPNFFRLDTVMFCINRFGGAASKPDHYLYKSTDNGETWSAARKIMGINSTSWAYPITFATTDVVYHHVIDRENGVGEFTKIYVLKSTDGDNWGNLDGDYSHDITISSIPEDSLNAHYLIDSVSVASGEDMLPLAHYIEDSTNYYYMVYEDDEEGVLKFLKHEGAGYTIDTIQGITNNTDERGYMGLLVKNSAGGFDYFHNESDAAGTYAIRKYQTFDDFQTVSGPEYIGESTTQDYNSIVGLGNWVPGLPFLVIANRVDENDLSETDTFIYQYWP